MHGDHLSWHSYASQVVRAFDGLATSDLTNGMRVGESEVFNSAQQSAEIRLFRRMAFGSQEYSTDFFSQSSLNSQEAMVKTGREDLIWTRRVFQAELEPVQVNLITEFGPAEIYLYVSVYQIGHISLRDWSTNPWFCN